MKKKNWLMTIAFAVLALTIVSTCVIGSTYAKFTSDINGGSKVQAAGFKVGVTSELSTSATLLKPGLVVSQDVTVSYFSQVDSVVTASAATITLTGGLTNAGWDAMLTAYKGTTDGAADNAVEATGEGKTKISDVFVVTIGTGTASTLANDFAALVRTTGTLDGTGANISAMAANAATALTVTVPVKITWHTLSDAFDTYLGNLIATYATTAANSSAPQTYVQAGVPLTVSQVV